MKPAWIAMLLACTVAFAQTDKPHVWSYTGRVQSKSCQIIEDDTALETALRKAGWDATRGGFPKIDWAAHDRAAVVTTTDASSQVTHVSEYEFPKGNGTLYVSLESKSELPARTIWVVELGSKYESKTCRLGMSPQEVVQILFKGGRGTSLTSAGISESTLEVMEKQQLVNTWKGGKSTAQ